MPQIAKSTLEERKGQSKHCVPVFTKRTVRPSEQDFLRIPGDHSLVPLLDSGCCVHEHPSKLQDRCLFKEAADLPEPRSLLGASSGSFLRGPIDTFKARALGVRKDCHGESLAWWQAWQEDSPWALVQ